MTRSHYAFGTSRRGRVVDDDDDEGDDDDDEHAVEDGVEKVWCWLFEIAHSPGLHVHSAPNHPFTYLVSKVIPDKVSDSGHDTKSLPETCVSTFSNMKLPKRPNIRFMKSRNIASMCQASCDVANRQHDRPKPRVLACR